ncbi:MAG: hypothetical protein ACFFD1_14380 [Candidatus Thorarchaeota archaeon]
MSTTELFDLEKIKKEVKGTTLKVYLLLARSKDSEFGVREIQRILNFSSVSLASYHLSRLESLDLVKKTPQNRYQISHILPLGKFDDFFVLKGRYLPKEAFYACFFTGSTIMSIIFLLSRLWGPLLLLLFVVALISTATSLNRFIKIIKTRDEQEDVEEEN